MMELHIFPVRNFLLRQMRKFRLFFENQPLATVATCESMSEENINNG
jgi:hypothetical protein